MSEDPRDVSWLTRGVPMLQKGVRHVKQGVDTIEGAWRWLVLHVSAGLVVSWVISAAVSLRESGSDRPVAAGAAGRSLSFRSCCHLPRRILVSESRTRPECS